MQETVANSLLQIENSSFGHAIVLVDDVASERSGRGSNAVLNHRDDLGRVTARTHDEH